MPQNFANVEIESWLKNMLENAALGIRRLGAWLQESTLTSKRFGQNINSNTDSVIGLLHCVGDRNYSIP